MWDFFDKIYCINLTTRPDRRETVKVVFDKYGIPVTFYDAIPHPISGIQGCFESHINIIKESYEKGYDNILIFEDDIVNSINLNDSTITECINFLKSNIDWELFYFSMYPNILHYKMSNYQGNINKVHAYWGSGYAVSRKGMKKYMNLTYDGKEVDTIYVKNDQAYGYWPTLFYQSDSPSNLRSEVKGYNGETNMAEWYATNINQPLVPIILFAAFALLVVIMLIIFFVS